MAFKDLFKPKWEHSDPKVRAAAVKMTNFTDQILLSEIAKNDKDSDVRKEAVKKITNQALLVEIAKNDEDWKVREAAVKKIKDQALLADIAKNDEDWKVRNAARERDHDHDWRGCRCIICGSKRDIGHFFIRCECENCGKIKHQGEIVPYKVPFGNVQFSQSHGIWYKCTACGKRTGNLGTVLAILHLTFVSGFSVSVHRA